MIITGKTALAGVMGWPIAHSLSPRLHNHWIAHLGLDAAYVPFAVRPEGLGAAARGLEALGIKGVNVTVPHKVEIMAHLDHIDETAEAIGAVNTVILMADGALHGTNTDAHGFSRHLVRTLPDWRRQLAGRPILVVGAGGAARAVLHSLIGEKCEIWIVNRSTERAQALADRYVGRAAIVLKPWEALEPAIAEAGLVINTTTMGMSGAPSFAAQLHRLRPDAIVYDLVYNPLETELLAETRRRGAQTVDGLGMLIEQAAMSFELWFGIAPPVDDEVRALLLRVLTERA